MAEDIGSLRVSISMDEADFNQSLASVERNVKALGQEMSGIRAKGKEWGDSTEGLKTKQDALSRLMDAQGIKVKKLNDEYQKAVIEQGENSKAAETLAIKLNKANAEYTRTETELSEVNALLKKQEAELKDTRNAWEKTADSMNKTGDKLQSFGDKAKTVGTGLTTGVTAPILAIGAAGIAAFNEVDEAMDTIITKTGATGEAVEGLEKSFQTVAQRVPDDIVTVGEAIGEVNTQFGFLGKELEDNTQLMLEFASINGTDVTASSISAKQAIQAYGLANKDLSKVLDAVTKTAQDTGQSVDYLFSKAVEGAPQIKALGLTFSQGTALIGSFEKAGVDSATALSSLSKASVVYAKDGKTMEQGLNDTVKAILGAKTETEALTIAAEVFGTKGAVRMVDAIKRGTFNLEQFSDAGTKAAGAVKKTFNETVDPIDEAKIALNNAKIAMSDVGDAVQVAMLPFLKEATNVLKDITVKFQELDPETKEAIVKFGLLAAAIGPTVLVGGHMATGLGSILKAASPLVSIIGKAGLAGSFAALANPVGLTVAGVVGLTAAVGLGIKAYQEANEVNLESINAKQKEIEKNDELIAKFDELKTANMLSTDEMLRFMDIQQLLKSTGAPEEIARLKDEQALLLEKSGLTNDEMNEFLGLNDKVIEKAPSTIKSISGLGQVYADNTNALKELNAEQARQLEIEAYEAVKKSIEEINGKIREQKQTVSEINEIEEKLKGNRQQITELQSSIKGQEELILSLEKEKEGSNSFQVAQLEEKILKEKNILAEQKNNLTVALDTESTYGNQLNKRLETLDTIAQEIQKSEEARFKYEEIILTQAGITAEKGRGLAKIDQEIGKLNYEKTLLDQMLATGKINTAEYNEQNTKLNTQIGKLQDAQGELQYINKLAGQTIYKDIRIQSNPSVEEFERALKRPITRYVNVITSGNPVPAYASGTKYAPGGLSLVGEEGPELMYVPKGARIIPNDDSSRILQNWNVPTQNSRSVTSNNVSTKESSKKLVIQIPVNGNVIAEAAFPDLNILFGESSSSNEFLKGVK